MPAHRHYMLVFGALLHSTVGKLADLTLSRQTDRKTDRQADKQTIKQTDRQADTQMDRQTNRI